MLKWMKAQNLETFLGQKSCLTPGEILFQCRGLELVLELISKAQRTAASSSFASRDKALPGPFAWGGSGYLYELTGLSLSPKVRSGKVGREGDTLGIKESTFLPETCIHIQNKDGY